jgi:hypothetical protein
MSREPSCRTFRYSEAYPKRRRNGVRRLVAASNSSSANTSALLTIESGPSAFVGQLPSSAFASMSAMATLTASLSTTICKAVLVAVHEESAPLSACLANTPARGRPLRVSEKSWAARLRR